VTKPLQKTLSGLTRTSEILAAFGVIVCVGLNLAQVVCRYFLYAPLSWSEEVMRYSMIWVAMLGTLAALGRAELPAINLVAETGSFWIRRLAAAIAALSISVFCATLVVAGWPTLQRAFRSVSPAAEIPLHYAYLAVFVGCSLIALVAIVLPFVEQPPGGEGSDA
jgi:TRAP-type C4-dicarboxylate transport system permease small subunit